MGVFLFMVLFIVILQGKIVVYTMINCIPFLSHTTMIPVILAARLNIYPFGFNESNQVNKPYIYLDGYNKFSNNYLDAYKKTL